MKSLWGFLAILIKPWQIEHFSVCSLLGLLIPLLLQKSEMACLPTPYFFPNLKKGMVDDYNTMMNMAREYEVVKQVGRGWEYFTYKAEGQEKIKQVWKANPSEYIRAEQEIIKRAKERLSK